MSDLAERIATDLFVNGQGEEAERLVLELEDKMYGGGWCRAAVVDRIDRHVEEVLDENVRLLEALKPFALEFDSWAAGGVTSGPVDIKAPEDHGCDIAYFTVGDLKRANELVNKHE